jgi:hypothetical protein
MSQLRMLIDDPQQIRFSFDAHLPFGTLCVFFIAQFSYVGHYLTHNSHHAVSQFEKINVMCQVSSILKPEVVEVHQIEVVTLLFGVATQRKDQLVHSMNSRAFGQAKHQVVNINFYDVLPKRMKGVVQTQLHNGPEKQKNAVQRVEYAFFLANLSFDWIAPIDVFLECIAKSNSVSHCQRSSTLQEIHNLKE